ncbi:hypothetical protein Tco_0149787 [Tanacetum coccineum]
MGIQDMEDLKQQYLDGMKTLINEKDYCSGRIDIEIKINELNENFNEMSIEINKKKKLQQLEQVANLSTYPSRHFNSFCYDDDDEEEYTIAITPEKSVDSLIMEDEHLEPIPETESNEFIKFSVENLVPTPSESEDFSDIENSSSSDDESSHEEVIDVMSFKTYSNLLFDLDEEIISSEFNPIHNEDLDSTPKDVRFDAESYLLESLVNRDTFNASPPKIDFLLDEFSDELTRLQLIPPGIDNINLDSEGDILFLESLLYDNSSPRPPKSFQANSDTIIESLLTFPIPDKDSDSLRQDIDIFSGPDNSIPSDRNKIYDLGICIEVESTRFLAPLSPVIDTLLPFSSENEDKVFNHGVLAYKEKSPPSSSHRGLKAFQLSPESLMLIHADNTPNLDVRHPISIPPLTSSSMWGSGQAK